MKKNLTVLILLLSFFAHGQVLTTTPSGGNKKAWVGERVGLTDVTVMYDRPGVKGREGKIWGQLVHYGYKDLGFGTTKAAPWRAGANENTTIEFSNPVKIEGQDLPAGKYGFMIEVQPDHCVLIFNKRTTSWGSYFYDPKEDVLKVSVKQIPLDKSVEWLKYEFSNETASGATLSLQWEKWSIPFKIETDLVRDQMNIFRQDLTSSKSFDFKNLDQAASYANEQNVNLDEALAWSNRAMQFGGDVNFKALSTKASLLAKLNRQSESDSIMKMALPYASKGELFNYGVSLIKKNQKNQAMEIFKMDYAKFPKDYLPAMGMARAYAAQGDYASAIKYANIALSLAPSDAVKETVKDKIKKLQNKEDIN